MPNPTRKYVESFYLVALLIGTLVPLSFIVPWLLDNGPDIQLFVRTLFETPVSSYFGWDVIISVIVLWSMCVIDDELPARERAAIALSSFLGASVGIPAFLWLRARHRRRARTVSTEAVVRCACEDENGCPTS